MYSALLIGLLSEQCASAMDQEAACAAVDDVVPICGLQRPEDLEIMPGEKLILISEYGSLNGAVSGRLTSYRIADGEIERLFPQPDIASQEDTGKPGWGDAACPGPPGAVFDPHGIYHNATIAPQRLFVVNHGGRESIELFEISLIDNGRRAALTWRGCVLAPDGAWFNDVVSAPDGKIIVSHMMSRDLNHDQLIQIEHSKQATGYVLEWSMPTGWQQVKNSEGALTNGIEISADGSILFINYYLGDEVIALERASGKILWRATIPGPDNSSWAPDGRLLVTSHRDDLSAVMHCSESAAAFCPVRYAVVAVNPQSGKQSTLITGGGAPMGGATVAVQQDKTLYLGSFAGNRMIKRPIARQVSSD